MTTLCNQPVARNSSLIPTGQLLGLGGVLAHDGSGHEQAEAELVALDSAEFEPVNRPLRVFPISGRAAPGKRSVSI